MTALVARDWPHWPLRLSVPVPTRRVVAADERKSRALSTWYTFVIQSRRHGLWQLAAWRGRCRRDVHGGGDVRAVSVG